MKIISNLVVDVWVDRGAVYRYKKYHLTLDNGEKIFSCRLLSPAISARAGY